MDRYPSAPDGLTPLQERVRRGFWQLVLEQKPCGRKSVAEYLDLKVCTTDTTLQRLRSLRLIPPRQKSTCAVPAEWTSLIPAEFVSAEPVVAPVADKPAKTNHVYPEHIEPADVGHPYGDLQARIEQLEAELASLRKVNEWLSHSDSPELVGGTFTLNLADLHYFDRGHLLNTHKSLEQKVFDLLDRFKPHRFQCLINGDVIPGTGVYRNQGLESLLSDTEQQCSAGAWRWMEFRTQLVEHLHTGCDESYVFLRGNHDTSLGTDTVMRLVLALRTMGLPCKYAGSEYVLNLADTGTYNCYCEHGHGNSSFHPTSNAQIVDSYRKLISLSGRGYTGDKAIRRVLHGHSHFLCVGVERAENVKYDTVGGGHRNDRIDLGRNTRPVGWIVYVSPPGAADIISPIEVVPTKEALRSDLDDPNLLERNRSEAARCLIAWADWARSNGLLDDIATLPT